MGRYGRNKDRAREMASSYLNDTQPRAWSEVADMGNRLERLAVRYGLVREFRENGII